MAQLIGIVFAWIFFYRFLKREPGRITKYVGYPVTVSVSDANQLNFGDVLTMSYSAESHGKVISKYPVHPYQWNIVLRFFVYRLSFYEEMKARAITLFWWIVFEPYLFVKKLVCNNE